jgi:hypothetical protein
MQYLVVDHVTCSVAQVTPRLVGQNDVTYLITSAVLCLWSCLN